MTSRRLSEAVLDSLPIDVARPAYDRSAVRTGIVHLGLGAFHRAHQAVFTEDRLNAGESEWGIVGASLRSPATRDALTPQDCLYTVATRSGEATRMKVIGAINAILVAPQEPERLLDTMVDPATRMVTLTITEKGYTADITTGDLATDHADVQHDLAGNDLPRTALGFLCEAIARRRAAGTAPFTLLSCDNLPANGATLKRAITQFAELRDADLGRFVADEIACPSTMVDRIVPATTEEDRREVAAALGVEDVWPVVAEPFHQWVVEDRFALGRPAWEESGVEFVDDVAPYETMKLRLLNGAHTLLAAVGRAAGFATVADAMADPQMRAFLKTYWGQAIPTIDPRIDGNGYTARLEDRFDNTALKHATAQIASDASQKLPQRVLAPLQENLAAGRNGGALVFAVAAWITSCAGFDGEGRALVLNDPVFQAAAPDIDQASAPAGEIVDAFLALSGVFGSELPRHPGFRNDLVAALDDIRRMGIVAAMAARTGASAAT